MYYILKIDHVGRVLYLIDKEYMFQRKKHKAYFEQPWCTDKDIPLGVRMTGSTWPRSICQ